MKKIIDEIVQTEWEMFQDVRNIGGRSSCQDNRTTFDIMRASQFDTWPRLLLESYLQDLQEARDGGENLLVEKYARMMEYTSPLEYENIKHLLKHPDSETISVIEQIVGLFIEWNREIYRKYPYTISQGRPLTRGEDSFAATSVETYLRGEISTYSLRTLNLYLEYLTAAQKNGENPAEQILERTAQYYGYKDLEEAEQRIAKKFE